MSNTLPAGKPALSRGDLIKKILAVHPNFLLPDFFVCGIRGYYANSMGKPGNDRQLYDDAIFLVTKDEMIPYNGNTDPSAFKLSIACLKPGIWPVYKFDLHSGKYLALCQRAGKVTVVRDGKGEDTGNFGINIHRGGVWGTGSLGCQTIPPSQWDNFIELAQVLAKKHCGARWKLGTYTYVLLEN